ncbi:MAG: acetate/propionate family kinase [Gammaproteobacteria bacterium]
MLTLVLNCGSSSLKYLLLDDADEALTGGIVERLDTPEACHRQWCSRADEQAAQASRAWPAPSDEDGGARHAREDPTPCPGTGIGEALTRVASSLTSCRAPTIVAHRIVHGGTRFVQPAILDAAAVAALRELVPLAPLHMPSAILGIEAASRAWPSATQVGVFDTAFHATLPPEASRYALPAAWREGFGLRRYGFHGSAHASSLRAAAAMLGRPPTELNLVTLHLGNGASMAAIRRGRCVETSMGFTPLEGLVMGTRCGDIDPALPLWLVNHAGLAPQEVERILLEESGLRALCGDSDMREVCARAAAAEATAELALGVYCHRIRKYLGAYAAVLGALDAIVFSGGVGEAAAPVRERICAGLGILGIAIDPARNHASAPLPRAIHAGSSRVAVLVLQADEEREIAREAQARLGGARPLN